MAEIMSDHMVSPQDCRKQAPRRPLSERSVQRRQVARLTSRRDSTKEPNSFHLERSCEARCSDLRAWRRPLSRLASDEACGVDALAMGTTRVAATLPPVESGRPSLAPRDLRLVAQVREGVLVEPPLAHGHGNTGKDQREASGTAFEGKGGERGNLGSGRWLANRPSAITTRIMGCRAS